MSRLFACFSFLVAALALSAPAGAQSSDPANTVVMETTKGTVTFVLRPDLAPQHAERIKLLVREKFYDGAPFHRVIPGFMAQTGDGAKGDGTGNSKHPNLRAEFSNEKFVRGTVGMARSRDPNSGNSQFFITFAPASHLDGGYTVVGTVTSGMEVVDALKAGSPANNGSVSDPDRIVRMTMAK